MTHRKEMELELISGIPGYRVILKAVLKSQITYLMEQLSGLAGEETLLLAACIQDGSVCQLGSEQGRDFLQTRDEIKGDFIRHCVQRQQQTTPTLLSRQSDTNHASNASDQSKTISRRKTCRKRRSPYAKHSAETKASKSGLSSSRNLNVIPGVSCNLPEKPESNINESCEKLGKVGKRKKCANLNCDKTEWTNDTGTQSVTRNQSANYTRTQSGTGNQSVNKKQRKSRLQDEKPVQGFIQTRERKLDEICNKDDVLDDRHKDNEDIEDEGMDGEGSMEGEGGMEGSDIVADDVCDDVEHERGMVREPQAIVTEDNADLSDGVTDEDDEAVIVDRCAKGDHLDKQGDELSVDEDLHELQQSSEVTGDHLDELENDEGRYDPDQSGQCSNISTGGYRKTRMGQALPDTLRASIVFEIVQLEGDVETGSVPRGVLARVSQKFKVHATSVSRIWENYVLNRTISPRQPVRKQ